MNPDLVARDEQGKPYTVCYEAANAMLLNEFLKEHRQIQELKATVVELKSTVAQQKGLQSIIALQHREIRALTARLDAQESKTQKVSDQLEGSKPAPQLVENQ